jgi:hypothetical protein
MTGLSATFDKAVASRRRFAQQSSAMSKWLEKYKSLLVFGALVLSGVGLHFWHWSLPDAWRWVDETRVLLAHALIVAGLIGGTVDTLLKAALIRDVGSLFVGWALPQEIRNYIREISQTSIVRRNYQIHYVLRQLGPDVVVQITHDCDVYNYSTGLRKYAPALAVDLMENPDITGVALEITRGDTTKRWDPGALNACKKREMTPQLIDGTRRRRIGWHRRSCLTRLRRATRDGRM